MLFSKKYPIAVVTIICLSCLKFSIPSPVPEKYVSCSDPDKGLRHPDCEHTWTDGNKYYFDCTAFDCQFCDCGRHTEMELDGQVRHWVGHLLSELSRN